MAEARCDVSVIDDDEPVRKSLQRLLRSMGFHVATFASAEHYLQADPRQESGCLLLDVRLPGMSGVELQGQLRRSGCNIAIIFMTAHEDALARCQALAAGALAVLQKPLAENTLFDAVARALGRVP
jgi:FixJ family two-component response regulator